MGKADPDDSISLSYAMCFLGSTVISVINEESSLVHFSDSSKEESNGSFLYS